MKIRLIFNIFIFEDAMKVITMIAVMNTKQSTRIIILLYL